MNDEITELSDLVDRRMNSGPENPIDAEVCAGSVCDHCGHKGLTYHSFRSHYGSYIAIAECPECKVAVEF